jgi:hypothetical protein
MSRYILTFYPNQGVPVKHARRMRALPFLSRRFNGESWSKLHSLHFLNDVPERATQRKHVETPIQRLSPRFRHAKATGARSRPTAWRVGWSCVNWGGSRPGSGWISAGLVGPWQLRHRHVRCRPSLEVDYKSILHSLSPTRSQHQFSPITPITKLTPPSQWLLSTVRLPSTPPLRATAADWSRTQSNCAISA